MKQTITEHTFINDMMSVRPYNFSREGLEHLFAYIEEYEESTDTEFEFDPIGLCCEFSEYASWGELLSAYTDFTKDEIRDSTTVIETPSGRVIIADF